MGNVTSNLIESAIQSANNESDSCSASDSITTDPSKLELYRLLREKMADTDGNQKNPTSGTDNNSFSDAANLAPVLAKEKAMMAPKKKFLIGYRGDEEESNCEKAGAGNFGVDVVAKVSPTPSSTSADVARSRSHTVSLPFRTRGPPQTQPEVPRRPLMESKPSDTVSSVRSGMMTTTDSQVSTPCDNQPPTPVIDTSASTIKPHRATVELSASVLQPFSVGHDMMSSGQGGYLSVDRYQALQQQQRLTPSVSSMASSYSPRYHRDSAGVMEAGGGSRQMPQLVQRVRDRPVMMSDPGSGLVEPSSRNVPLPFSEPHVIGVKYDAPVTTHPVVERQLDRRFLPPGGTDRPPPHVADRHFVVPTEYWKEAAVDDRRRVGRQMLEPREVRAAVGHDPYLSQVSVPVSRCVDPHITVTERALATSHYMPPDNRSLPPDHAAGSYPSRSADFARGWPGQHLSADSYRHSSGVVELPTRESRAGRPHYDMGDVSQHMRKYPVNEGRMSTAEYGSAVATADVQYNRHQLREPMTMQTGGGAEVEPHIRRSGPHAAPLQPVEPSVRPRIAGLTHGDPAIYEPPLPQFDSSRYPAEHAYRSSKYDLVERPRPSSDALTQLMPLEPKQVQRHSPYYSSGVTRSSVGTSVMLGTGSSAGSMRVESAARVTSESPLDLTVRKEQSMTAEAFLRRCHDSSQRSSQYSSPGRHTTELQYSSYPSHHWPTTSNEGFESSHDVRQRLAGVAGTVPAESMYPRHMVQRAGDAVRPIHSAVREYPPHLEPDVRRHQHAPYPHHQRPDDDDAHLLYSRRDADARWDSARQPGSSVTVSPVIKPAYWDGRYAGRPVHTNTEMSESVTDSRSHGSNTSYVGDVGWMGERLQYGARFAKSTNTEPAALGIDHRAHASAELPLALSPQNVPTTAASRRIPMVQLLGGKYSPNDILHLCCKVCGSTYGSLRSFRMHFAKAHGQEPTPENFTIQTISDARIQAMSQRAQEAPLGDDSPPTLQIESSGSGTMGVGRDVAVAVDVDQHKRGSSVCEFSTTAPMKPRSVAEVQPIQKASLMVLDQGPPTPVSKPPLLDEATKRSGEDRRMKCKKCGQFSTQDLSVLRQHVRSHGSSTSETQWSSTVCECSDALDSDTGCAVCLEGFNDVSDWQHHVTSQHMMRSCICKSCDLGFTNASALRRHLTATHGIQSPTGSNVKVEYRCLFCPEAFMDEHSLYAHTRAHEQQYSTQRAQLAGRGSALMRVQTAVPDTTCPEDQRTSAADVTSLDAAVASCTMELEVGGKRMELEMARKNIEMAEQRKNIEMAEHSDVTIQRSTATLDVRLNSKKASILRRLSAVHNQQNQPVMLSDTLSIDSCSNDVGLTSSAVTSSASVMTSAVSGADEVEITLCRQQTAPVVFGDLLSSMHHEVESTLRQLDTPTTTSTPTPLTPATLASSPCVRDVCDAIIVHALRQRDVTQTTESLPPQDAHHRPLEAGIPQQQQPSCSSDFQSGVTETKPVYTSAGQSEVGGQREVGGQSEVGGQCKMGGQSEVCGQREVGGRAGQSKVGGQCEVGGQREVGGRLLECSKPHPSSGSDTSCMSDAARSRSRVVDSELPCLTDSRSTDHSSQVSDVKKNNEEPVFKVTDSTTSPSEDSRSRMTESKSSLIDCSEEWVLPDAVGATATTTASTTSTAATAAAAASAMAGADDDGDVKKAAADISSHEAEDVDMDDQPLCIDLNRDPSPDEDTISHL